MRKNCRENGWVRKYRMVLLLVLAAVLLLAAWYCISTYQKKQIPKEATLVKQEEVSDEREA